MSEEALARVVRPGADVLERTVGEELVLLDLATEEYFALNEVGAAMWRAVVAADDLRTARDALLEEFDAPAEELTADLLELVDQLVAKGLLAEGAT